MRFWLVLVAALTLLPACGSARAVQSAGQPEPTPAASPAPPPAPAAPAIVPSEPDSSATSIPDDPPVDPRLVAAVVEALSGRGGAAPDPDDEPPSVQQTPVALWVDGIEILEAPVVEVGVEPNGEMEIPGGGEVGWYKYGPSPGSEGSAVLAAHVAFDGQDGVFRHLDDLSPGSRVVVGYDDDSTTEFEIVDLEQYGKTELPFDRVFAKQGDPVLTLITCGGAFDSSSRSYSDNVVAYAVPVEG